MVQDNRTLQRFWFTISTTKQWYDIMRECRAWAGSNWRTQPKVKRKLAWVSIIANPAWASIIDGGPIAVWFDIPDEKLAIWVAIKMGLEVCSDYNHKAAK